MAATFNTVFMQGLLNLQFLKFKKPFDFEKNLLPPCSTCYFFCCWQSLPNSEIDFPSGVLFASEDITAASINEKCR